MILGISNDPPEANRKFREKFDFPFDLLSDEDLTVSMAYGAAASADAGKATRITYLIGPDGTIEQVYGAVKPSDHPDEVLGDIP